MVLQVVPDLQIDSKLRSELMAPAAAGVTLHHGDGVVLLLIATYVVGNSIRIAVLVAIKVVSAVTVNHILSHSTSECYGQCGSQVQGRTQGRTPCRVGVDTCAMCAHIREVCADVQFVQEVALL